MASIGANVKYARVAAGMSQEQLARALDVSVFTVSRMERDVGDISVRKLTEVAAAVGVNVTALLESNQEGAER
jgi:transcriptional regulator with XRE-family HTH domain